MRYPHGFVVTRSGAGTQDPDTGAPTPGATTTVYDGMADVQDAGAALRRTQEGRADGSGDAVVFLEDESGIGSFQLEDLATVTWEDGSTDVGRIAKIVRIDGTLHLNWL